MLDAAKATLTRQVGPLPLYAWAGVGVLGFVAYRLLTGGSSGTQQTLGQITDANPGIGDGGGDSSGDGTTHIPVGSGGTGTVGGNGTSYTVLTITGKAKNYSISGTDSVKREADIPASSTRYVVKRVTYAGHTFYRIIGKIGAGGVVQKTGVPFLNRMISYQANPTTYKISTTTPTQAAA